MLDVEVEVADPEAAVVVEAGLDHAEKPILDQALEGLVHGIVILQDGSNATMEPVYPKRGNVTVKLIAQTDLTNGIARLPQKLILV